MTSDRSAVSAAHRSLEEVHGSVPIPPSRWKRLLAFSGPAFLVSVGYMDPGNWGTDLEAGSSFSYRLLWVLLMSNLMAVLLQSLAARLGIVTGRDLAQACRESYPRRTVFGLWVLCEIAIAACDLAEVIGTVIALKLLFNLPYTAGLVVAAADTFVLLALQKRGVRLIEVLTLALIGVIGVCFVVEIVLARPDWGEVVRGFVPGLEPGKAGESLYLAIGMLGATVMPHNLYLHSALVQTRAFAPTPAGKRMACNYNLLDSFVALNGAFFINAAILVLAAAKFAGHEVETLQDAHRLLAEVLGTAAASVLFAVALLASGQSSTFTGTLAGQVVMEGFVRFRLRPSARRLLTRSVAIVPALVVITLAGQGADDIDGRLLQLLVLSQVVLSFQLPFAIVPLVHFTSDRRRMGEFASGRLLKGLAWACAVVVVGLNLVFIVLQTGKWAKAAEEAGWDSLWVYAAVAPLGLGVVGFLGWVALYPLRAPREEAERPPLAPVLPAVRFERVGVAVELEGADDALLAQAAAVARQYAAELLLIHVVEGPAVAIYGAEAADLESRADQKRMAELVDHLRGEGLRAEGTLGHGTPAKELVRIVNERRLDLLVVGTHGHRLLADLALGHTVAPVLHRLTIPVLVVPARVNTSVTSRAHFAPADHPRPRGAGAAEVSRGEGP